MENYENATSDNALILVVDDNLQNIEVLGSVLQDEKYNVAFATSGSQALDFLKEELPDLILLDIMMPGMNGFEVCEIIKNNAVYKEIPIIFLTAKGETDDIVKGFELGAADYITKPFSSRELLARTKTHIDAKRAKEEIKTLRGIIPICAKCKKVRDDRGYWNQVEEYIQNRTNAVFSHGVCPQCSDDLYGEEKWYQKMKTEEKDG